MKINVLLSLVAATVSAAGATLNTERINQLTGLKGKPNEKGAYKISFPRNEIAVSVDSWKIPSSISPPRSDCSTTKSGSFALLTPSQRILFLSRPCPTSVRLPLIH